MLIYFFIPIILFILIKINIMAILICISLYVREMFCFKQKSSHRRCCCFFRRRGGGFSAHANETINTRLLTLTNSAPLSPTLPHAPAPGVSLAQPGTHRPMTAREKHLGLFWVCPKNNAMFIHFTLILLYFLL